MAVRGVDPLGEPRRRTRRPGRGVRRRPPVRGRRPVGSALPHPHEGAAPRQAHHGRCRVLPRTPDRRARAPRSALDRHAGHHRLPRGARRERRSARAGGRSLRPRRRREALLGRVDPPPRRRRAAAGRTAARALAGAPPGPLAHRRRQRRRPARAERGHVAARPRRRPTGRVPGARPHVRCRRDPRPEDRPLPRPARQPRARRGDGIGRAGARPVLVQRWLLGARRCRRRTAAC